MPPVARSPLTALVAVLAGLGLARAAARLAAFGVLIAVVVACVGTLTIGVGILRLLVLR